MRKISLIIVLLVLSALVMGTGGNGYLSIKSADGVEILVGGKLAGVVKDGQLFLELAAGNYEVTAQGYGFTPQTIRNVKVEPLKATTLEIHLKDKVISEQLSGKLQIDLVRKHGTVRIHSIPFNGAQVTINGESYGKTDIELSYFPEGQLSVEVEGPNRSKVNGIFFLNENKTLTLLADFIDKKIYQLYDESAQEKRVLVEGGTFTMGDTWSGGYSNKRPAHKVTFTYNFYIGKYETTFDEYDAFCEATGRSKPSDSGWGRGNRPVVAVTWWDSIAYCNWLSEKEGIPKAYDDVGNLLDKDGRITTDPAKVLGYRLPTEAEWEYAARGGNKSKGYKYSGSDNIDDVAWYWQNSGDNYLTGDWDADTIVKNNCRTQEVGKKAPNELGLYDMSGNVYEWCSDWYGNYSSSAQTNPYNNSGSDRVVRGGGWGDSATDTRVTDRYDVSPTDAYVILGFRICRTVF